MTAPVARVVVPDATEAEMHFGDVRASVYAPYEMRDLVKSFRGKRWNPDRKCWTVPARLADQVADVLRLAGCTVYVTRANGSPYDTGTGLHGHRSTPSPTWAEALFEAVGPVYADKVYRALSKVLHPDAGGDVALAQQLNDARRAAS